MSGNFCCTTSEMDLLFYHVGNTWLRTTSKRVPLVIRIRMQILLSVRLTESPHFGENFLFFRPCGRARSEKIKTDEPEQFA